MPKGVLSRRRPRSQGTCFLLALCMVFLHCAGQGPRVHATSDRLQDRAFRDTVKSLSPSDGSHDLQRILKMFLLAYHPTALGIPNSDLAGSRSLENPSLAWMGRSMLPRRSRHRVPSLSVDVGVSEVVMAESTQTKPLDLEAIRRKDFPILDIEAYPGVPLIYLDSGASSQKPVQVLDAMDSYYRTSHANVHRGAHALSIRATDAYEKARDQVKTFINAAKREEIVFTQGATDAINIVAMGWGQKLSPGDEIVLSVMEHHSNLVPWQLLAERTGVVLKFARITEDETLDIDHLISLMSERTKIVSIVHVSNMLGCINPVKKVSEKAHELGAVVLVDACQSVPHMPVDVQELGCDFLVASSHKMCGPTGIGFLYGKFEVLSQMPPVRGGGEMIDQVELEGSTYAPPPARFEAGTPPVAEAVGLGAACEYLQSIGMEHIYEHEKKLGKYLYDRLSEIPGIRIYGPKDSDDYSRAALVAFNCDGVHASDLSFFLDQDGIAVRSGHHCTQPLHKHFGAAGSCRASCYFYNSKHDVDAFVDKLKSTISMFKDMES